MIEKFKIKLKEFSTLILLVCILILYFFYTKPVGLYDELNSGSVRSIFISVIFNDLGENEINKVSNQYSITLEKEDFDECMKILNKYKYSKIPRLFRPTKFSDKIIDCTINYDGNILHQQVTIYSHNEVRLYNKKGVYQDYVVKENEEGLFEEMLIWLNEGYITYQ